MKLSPISLAVLPLLTVFTANAAVYQIVELDTTNIVRSTSGVAATNQGDIVSNGAGFLDFEVDLAEIDFDSEVIKALLTEEQLADAKNGIIDSKVKGILISYLVSNAGLRSQPIGSLRVVKQTQNGTIEHVIFRDVNNTKGNNEYAYGVNNLGQIAGTASAPSFKEIFTETIVPGETEPEVPVIPQPSTVWVPEPGYLLGYVADGAQSIMLPPAFTGLGGGMSAAQDINNNGIVAGFTSTGVSAALTETVEKTCNGNLQPVQYCLNSQMSTRSINLQGNGGLLTQVRNVETAEIASPGYEERAALWQLKPDGTASVVRTFGFLGEKGSGEIAAASEDYNAPFYYSRASAINDNDIAVGHSLYTDSDRTFRFFSLGVEIKRIYAAPHATIFNGEEVQGFIDTNEWLASIAVDINNQNLVVGYALKNINSAVRNRLFVYDLNNQQLKFPNGFFNSSNTEPKAVNNSGQVVGKAEVIIGGTTTRRSHAFLYDSTTDSFQDLNKLVGCDAPMLVEATSINDDGEILATALINRPLLGPNGEEQLAEDGSVIKQTQSTAVKLRPIANGQPENCDGTEATYERKSGSFSMFWLMLLGALPLLRRRKV